MRHTAHIMLGAAFGQTLCNIKQYVLKYGGDHEAPYFNAFLYDDNTDEATFSRAVGTTDDNSVFRAGIENLFGVELTPYYTIPSDNRAQYLQAFFTQLHTSLITINNPGDSTALHVCIYLPVYDEHAWQTVREMLAAADAAPQQIDIDLFMMPADLAFHFDTDPATLPVRMESYWQTSRKTINDAIAAKKECPSLKHLVLIQNCNSNGISLDLDLDSFVRIAGEYAILSVGHYSDMFNPAAEDSDRPLHALGLSVLSFDRYYFVQYLLHRAYIHILDREQVMQTEVDVNKVSQIVNDILLRNVNIFSNFYNNEVQPLIDRGDNPDSIIVAVKPLLDDEIARLTKECQTFINEDELSLPEKKAALAQLLGEDDELLVGNLFNQDQLVIDDSSREVLDFFVKSNNLLAALHSNEPESYDNQRESIAEHAALDNSTYKRIVMPSKMLNEIKKLKISMRESTNYIRQKSRELNDLGVQMQENIDSKKRLTADGFFFEGHTYRLQKDIIENPCDEDYEPHENKQTKVDLRQHFTPVKNQGNLGACSAFTMVGIYEYILKKNHSTEADLSEYFVYYNVRKRNGKENEDNGSSLSDIVLTLANEGVCTEVLCQYSDTDHFVPTDDAYADGMSRRVVKALNVKKNLDDIKSAIADGYPVAVSLKIFDSFVPQNGFITRPSDEEIASGDSGNHAMIVCGYSDDDRIFIVRNSWGNSFGVDGYCYIPYSYFEDYLNVACIITEVSISAYTVGGGDSKTTISFDLTNSEIKATLLRILIDEEKHLLAANNRRLQKLETDYNQLFQRLGNNDTRKKIADGTEKRLNYEKELITAEKQKIEEERDMALQEYDKETLRVKIRFAIGAVVIILSYVIALIAGAPASLLFFSTWSLIGYVIMAIEVIWFILWLRKNHHDRIVIDEDYKAKIEECAREVQNRDKALTENKLKSHVAGMVIDSLATLFHNLHSKYNSMRSFLGNLCTWHKEEENADGSMSDLVRTPFLSLISNNCLDNYFDTCKDEITKPIRLYSMFNDSYAISEEQIIAFKNKMKQTIVNALFDKLNNFSVYSQIIGDEQYPYVDNNYVDINKLLQDMDNKSIHFVASQINAFNPAAGNSSCKILFIATRDNNAQSRWQQICTPNFQFSPLLCQSFSPFKLTELQMDGLAIDEIVFMK